MKGPLGIDTEPSSTTSKRIRGKVQIFVDEAALSSQTSPKVLMNTDSNTASASHHGASVIQSHLDLLEKQDEELT
jgi:hypothetical protein